MKKTIEELLKNKMESELDTYPMVKFNRDCADNKRVGEIRTVFNLRIKWK